jgi:hypothetical protein
MHGEGREAKMFKASDEPWYSTSADILSVALKHTKPETTRNRTIEDFNGRTYHWQTSFVQDLTVHHSLYPKVRLISFFSLQGTMERWCSSFSSINGA